MNTATLQDQIRTQVRNALANAKTQEADPVVSSLMQRFEAGYVAGNPEMIVACFAPDIEWSLPDARLLKGRGATLAFLRERFASANGPKFSESRMNVMGQVVVQNYKVSVPLLGGKTCTYDGTDVYHIRDGLIARKDAYWKQVGAIQAAAKPVDTPASGIVIPLRVGTVADAATLTELFKRLAASPALLQASDAGLLRFDLRLDAAAVQAVAHIPSPKAACCDACAAGRTCECGSSKCDVHEHKAATTTELTGVIGEKAVKALQQNVKSVRLNPQAVMTPLGKEALRKRGITIDRGDKA
ncbi:MAG: hypothetical protein RL302_2384 [Pseudomonadota bacterium]|jgi:ketosteroid isomerase-like protein